MEYDEKNLLDCSTKIKAEADQFADRVNLFSSLSRFGDVMVTGSYHYDLMVAKDLDIDVYVKEFTRQEHIELAQTYYMSPLIESVRLMDNNDARDAKVPKGYYLWLHSNTGWNVDVWFMNPKEVDRGQRQQLSIELQEMNQKQKLLILYIKKWLVDHKHKFMPGQGSIEIYRSVLKGMITDNNSAKAFAQRYLRTSR